MNNINFNFDVSLSLSAQNKLFHFTLGTALILFFLALLLVRQSLKSRQQFLHLRKENKARQNELQDYQHRFETIFDHTNVGIALINLEGKFIKINQAWCEMLGYDEQNALYLNFYNIIHPNDLSNLQISIQELIDDKIKFYQAEQRLIRKNGDSLWILATLSLIRHDHRPLYFIAQIQDITLQKKAEERLKHMAYHDPLTGLANRNKLEQFIGHILASARRHQQGFALLFLDLDRFKNINDTIGHDAGDLLLQVIGDRLRNAVRDSDIVARLGGDEFVVLVTDVKKTESVALIAQKILQNVLQVVIIKGQEIYITTSIGISLFPYDGQTIQSLMKNADLALYRAKEHGRNNYQFYTVEMTSRAQEKMAMQSAIGHALVKNEFELFYQPKMDIKTRRITGVEALLRWQNKDYGMILPEEIIALAEENGLIIPVSEWIIKTACKQLKTWHDAGFSSLTVAINCTARQFKQATFVDDVLKIVNEVGLSPASIEIEITESMIMQDPENTLRVLYALKDLGMSIVIDDFGTGYWSLGNLRRLSVDKIKIDRTFIKQMVVDETSAAITRAIIAMVNKLGIQSIAEGVETREQYELLIQEGCTEIQGYYLTQPLTQELMTNFLKHPVPDAEAITKNEIQTE